MNLPVEVVEAIQDGKCVLFAGRRGSLEAAELAGADFPGEKKLSRKLAGRKASFQEAAAGLLANGGRAGLVEALKQHVGTDGLEPTAFHHDALKRFPLIFTSAWDDLFERAAKADGLELEVRYRGDDVPEPAEDKRVLYKFWGGFERPDELTVTVDDQRQNSLPKDITRQLRLLLRGHVLLFSGYRPDETEFEQVFEDLSESYGGELPRCHLAVSQGRISDLHWQKWVWRGLLMFTADPTEVMEEVARQTGG